MADNDIDRGLSLAPDLAALGAARGALHARSHWTARGAQRGLLDHVLDHLAVFRGVIMDAPARGIALGDMGDAGVFDLVLAMGGEGVGQRNLLEGLVHESASFSESRGGHLRPARFWSRGKSLESGSRPMWAGPSGLRAIISVVRPDPFSMIALAKRSGQSSPTGAPSSLCLMSILISSAGFFRCNVISASPVPSLHRRIVKLSASLMTCR